MPSRSWVAASMTHRNTGFFPSLNAGAVRATVDVMLVASDSSSVPDFYCGSDPQNGDDRKISAT